MENKKQEFLEITTIGKRIGLEILGDYKLFAESYTGKQARNKTLDNRQKKNPKKAILLTLFKKCVK